MPRSAAPLWKRRLEPVLDHLIHASVQQTAGKTDEHGRYGEIHYKGCTTRERATEIRRAAFRSKRHTGYSVSASIKKDTDGTYRVVIQAVDPSMARKYMIDRYGPDRSKWPYSPLSRDPNYGGKQ